MYTRARYHTATDRRAGEEYSCTHQHPSSEGEDDEFPTAHGTVERLAARKSSQHGEWMVNGELPPEESSSCSLSLSAVWTEASSCQGCCCSWQ